jgi:hypothetical protein
LGAKIEKRRRAGSSFFTSSYFTDLSALKNRLKSGSDPLSVYLRGKLGTAVDGDATALADGLNKLIDGNSLYDVPARFADVDLSDRMVRFAKQNPPTANRVRLNRLLLEAAYPQWIAKSLGGLYPDREIIFLISACEMTLKMFGDWGNMASIKGIGIRLGGRICNTMRAFILSEQGIKPGLTTVSESADQIITESLSLWDKTQAGVDF